MTTSSLSGHRVVVIEDDEDILAAISRFLSTDGARVRGYRRLEDFVEALDWLAEIACIITDLRLPNASGDGLMEVLRSKGMSTPVIIVTGYGAVNSAVTAMKKGAFDFLEKPLDPERLKWAVTEAIKSASLRTPIQSEVEKARKSLSRLTERQTEILDLLCLGLTSKEIGGRLNMSYRTVETHRATLVDKMGVGSLAELIRLKFLSELPDAFYTQPGSTFGAAETSEAVQEHGESAAT